ncbi:rRNA pseudouridine synthase [bacterium]|jgi:23S rRNA pseudouridine2605 synthase|nr:rRNA pseudouridine synthase [bacterium]
MKQSIEQFIASQTPLSRRKITDAIKQGRVTVNNKVISKFTHLINPEKDRVKMDGTGIKSEMELLYFKLNKPRNIICTLEDPKGRDDLRKCLKGLPEQLFPIGRLDRNTNGLLLLTNDGNFAHMILHPTFEVPKTYQIKVNSPLPLNIEQRLKAGIFLSDGPVQAESVTRVSDNEVVITITEGRNRIIRRIFELFGYNNISLKRLSIGPIELEGLKEGQVAQLTKKELAQINKLGSNQ